jgi:hypothetical protein
MAADTSLLQGQIVDERTVHEKNVEGLLKGFLEALAREVDTQPSILSQPWDEVTLNHPAARIASQ